MAHDEKTLAQLRKMAFRDPDEAMNHARYLRQSSKDNAIANAADIFIQETIAAQTIGGQEG